MPAPLRCYHVEFNTFGTWLPGDPRGFRDHDHRIHSSGDYRHPPPPWEHQALHRSVRAKLHKSPVELAPAQRESAGQCLREAIQSQGLQIHVIAVITNHVHVLVCGTFDDTSLRKIVGSAKRKSSHHLRSEIPGSLWQRKIGVYPVRNESHRVNIVSYILAHAKQGAWVWQESESAD